MKPELPAERYHDVVAALVSAGATVRQDLLDWDKARADPKMLAALSGKPMYKHTHGGDQ